jgi:hypothetical protein
LTARAFPRPAPSAFRTGRWTAGTVVTLPVGWRSDPHVAFGTRADGLLKLVKPGGDGSRHRPKIPRAWVTVIEHPTLAA